MHEGSHRRHLAVDEEIAALYEEVKAELEDKYRRTKAMASAIGSKDIPEPYRSWAMERMAEYRRLQAERDQGQQPCATAPSSR